MAAEVPALPSRDAIADQVAELLSATVGFIARRDIHRWTNVDKDFRIDTDDISLFLLAVERRFGIRPRAEEWLSIEPTIDEIAGFVLKRLNTH